MPRLQKDVVFILLHRVAQWVSHNHCGGLTVNLTGGELLPLPNVTSYLGAQAVWANPGLGRVFNPARKKYPRVPEVADNSGSSASASVSQLDDS